MMHAKVYVFELVCGTDRSKDRTGSTESGSAFPCTTIGQAVFTDADIAFGIALKPHAEFGP